jgi:predicted transcriptional regulator YdeE
VDAHPQFQTAIFGPCRTMGMHYVGNGLNNEISQLWGQFCARMKEIASPEQAASFGICRCVPGASDDVGEYVAAIAAKDNATVPAGMVVVDLPRCDYAIFTVPEIPEARKVWRASLETVDRSTKWKRFACGPAGCTCTAHPAFEYYPPEYRGAGPFFIYIPLKPS